MTVHLHRLLRRSRLHKLQFWRSLLHLVLFLVDEGVVADRLAHLEVLRLALVVDACQVLVHVAHFRESLLADWARVPGFKESYPQSFCTFHTSYHFVESSSPLPPCESAHIVVVLLVNVFFTAV